MLCDCFWAVEVLSLSVGDENTDAGSAGDVAAEPHNAYDNNGNNFNRSDNSADADGTAFIVAHCGHCGHTIRPEQTLADPSRP